MTWVVVAVGVGSAVVGGAVSSDNARKAGNKQASANNADLAERKRQYDLTREDNNMWAAAAMNGQQELYERTRADNAGAMARGELAGNQLAYRMGLGGTGTGKAGGLTDRYKDFDFNFQADPGYQFRQEQGQSGVNNKMAASGNLLSGAAMKALTRFNQDYASNEYSNAYNRSRSGYENDRQSFYGANANEYNQYAGIQGAGQTATNTVAGIGSNSQNQISNALSGLATSQATNNNNYANAYSNYQGNAGNIGANQQMAYGKAWGQGLSGLSNAWNSYQSQNNGGGGWTNSGDYWSKGGNTYGNSGGYNDSGF